MADRFDELLYSVAEQANSAVDYDAMREAVLKKSAEQARRTRLRMRNLSMAAGLVLMLGAATMLFKTGLGGAKSGAGANMAPMEKSAEIAAASEAMPDERASMFAADSAQAPGFSLQAAPESAEDSMDAGMAAATLSLPQYDITGWQSVYIGEGMQQQLYDAFESVFFMTAEGITGELETGCAALSPDGGLAIWRVNAEDYAVVEDSRLTAENWEEMLEKSAK